MCTARCGGGGIQDAAADARGPAVVALLDQARPYDRDRDYGWRWPLPRFASSRASVIGTFRSYSRLRIHVSTHERARDNPVSRFRCALLIKVRPGLICDIINRPVCTVKLISNLNYFKLGCCCCCIDHFVRYLSAATQYYIRVVVYCSSNSNGTIYHVKLNESQPWMYTTSVIFGLQIVLNARLWCGCAVHTYIIIII